MALLALAPSGVLPRDRLMGVQWPEASTENARNLLNAAVFAVRRTLGEDVLISQGTSLCGQHRVTCPPPQRRKTGRNHLRQQGSATARPLREITCYLK